MYKQFHLLLFSTFEYVAACTQSWVRFLFCVCLRYINCGYSAQQFSTTSCRFFPFFCVSSVLLFFLRLLFTTSTLKVAKWSVLFRYTSPYTEDRTTHLICVRTRFSTSLFQSTTRTQPWNNTSLHYLTHYHILSKGIFKL